MRDLPAAWLLVVLGVGVLVTAVCWERQQLRRHPQRPQRRSSRGAGSGRRPARHAARTASAAAVTVGELQARQRRARTRVTSRVPRRVEVRRRSVDDVPTGPDLSAPSRQDSDDDPPLSEC